MNLNDLRLFLGELIQNSEFASKSYFAGGCVRDFILNPAADINGDVDICVELSGGGIALARFLQNRLQARELVIHKSFGTASIPYKNLQLEFVATRKEQYFANNRYPQVEFGTLTDDVLRRDFTINALLMSIATGEILDLCGKGLSDLKNGIIRTVKDANLSFKEDPLRMLRALQFTLRFDFTIEENTYKAMQINAPALKILSRRAINNELKKIPQSKKHEVDTLLDTLNWKPYLPGEEGKKGKSS